jgi:DNA replication and repair protein RecF
MRLVRLGVNHVRNLSDVHVRCSPHVNIICGGNASGKTSVLEAIYLLARGVSFRTTHILDVIQHGEKALAVTAELVDDNSQTLTAELEKEQGHTKAIFNGNRIMKRSEQAKYIPVLATYPDNHRLLQGAPRERRRWLDWSLFHVEPSYMETWKNYHYALRQRNALLRRNASNTQFGPWEKIMAQAGDRLQSARQGLVHKLNEQTNKTAPGVMGEITIQLSSCGSGQEHITSLLQEGRESDRVAGHTQSGAHRAEVVFCLGNNNAGAVLSRGEGKIYMLYLLLAQAMEHLARATTPPILLIDDLAAELDKPGRAGIFTRLCQQGLQLFVTTTQADYFPGGADNRATFHVEQGRIVKVVE